MKQSIMTTETWLETANKADATAKVIELCKGKYAEVIICEQEKVDANSKTMKYDDLLESTHKVWMLKHMTKLNDNRNDNCKFQEKELQLWENQAQ